MSTAQILSASPSLVGRKPGDDRYRYIESSSASLPYTPPSLQRSFSSAANAAPVSSERRSMLPRPRTLSGSFFAERSTAGGGGGSANNWTRATRGDAASRAPASTSSTRSTNVADDNGVNGRSSGNNSTSGDSARTSSRPRSNTTLSAGLEDMLCAAAERICAVGSGPCGGSGMCTGDSLCGNNAASMAEIDDEEEDILVLGRESQQEARTQAQAQADDAAMVHPTCTSAVENETMNESFPRLTEYNSLLDSASHSNVAKNNSTEDHNGRPLEAPPQHRGLHNLGNTCYLNSALQVLMTLEGFVDDVMDRTNCGELGNGCGTGSEGGWGGSIGKDGIACPHDIDCCSPGGPKDANAAAVRRTSTTWSAAGAATGRDENGRVTTGGSVAVDMARIDSEFNRGILAEARKLEETKKKSKDEANTSEEVGEEEKKENDANERNASIEVKKQDADRPLHQALGQVFSHLRSNAPNTPSPDRSTSSGSCRSAPSFSNQDATAVNPARLKEAVDAHAPQFVGYEQQDSHELLCTLLDMLDDEVKAKAKAAQQQKNQEQAASDGEQTDWKSEKKEAEDDEQHEEDLTISESLSSDLKSPCKRPRRSSPSLVSEDDDDADTDEQELSEPKSPPRNQSLTDLSVADISSLLHGKKAVDSMDNKNCGRPAASYEDMIGEAEQGIGSCVAQESQVKPTSPVEAHFATEIRTWLTCDSCKFSRSTIEKFRCLSLDVAATDSAGSVASATIEEALRRFFAPEKRDVKCEKCFFETATQTSEIAKLPRALLLHFKRFIVDVAPDYSSVSYRKDTRQVSFSEVIGLGEVENVSLSDYTAPDCVFPPTSKKPRAANSRRSSTSSNDTSHMSDETSVEGSRAYRLRGIVHHIGQSANRGHYTAVTYTGPPKRPSSASVDENGSGTTGGEEKVWTKFNDSLVTKISAEEALGGTAQKTAYMVLYALS